MRGLFSPFNDVAHKIKMRIKQLNFFAMDPKNTLKLAPRNMHFSDAAYDIPQT